MDFKFNIQGELNWFLEAIFLLTKVYNAQGNFDEDMLFTLNDEDKFYISDEEYNKKYSNLFKFQKNILKEASKLYNKDSFWQILFSSDVFSNAKENYVVSIYHDTQISKAEDLTKEEFAAMNFRGISNIFYYQGLDENIYRDLVDGKYKDSYFSKEGYCYRLDDIYELVEKTSLRAEMKFAIIKIFADLDKVFEEFKTMLIEAQEIIRKNLDPVAGMIKTLTKELKTDPVKERLANSFNLEGLIGSMSSANFESIKQLREFNVYVSPTRYDRGSGIISREKGAVPNLVVGLILFDILDLKEKESQLGEMIVDQAKAIGEKTRFEILLSLRERSYYLKELAEKLDTSSASLSHHLSALSDANLVSSFYDDRKVFYKLNSHEIEKFGKYFVEFSKELENGKED